jgi:hypothetical protein
MRAVSIFLFVLRGRRVAFKDKNINLVNAPVNPHSDPLPRGDGDKNIPQW